jgi:phosphopantothenoylcysteine synthetase/decarboxylase
MRVLVTAGGTREAIDGVRFITNASSGRTGAAIAEALEAAGHGVLLIQANRSVSELDDACRTALSESHFELVIHSAAVSDFVVRSLTIDGVKYPAPFTGKIGSGSTLSVELTPGKKILPELKTYSQNPELKLVGFKLTDGASETEIRAAVEKVLSAGADLVVHNDLRAMSVLRATLWDRTGPTERLATLADLCAALVRYAGGV